MIVQQTDPAPPASSGQAPRVWRLLLPIIAIIPVAEVISVMIQVAYFKSTKRRYGEGKRFFKMSPLHNHFVLLGWSEPQIVQRFFVIALLFGMIGVGLSLFGNPM